MLAHREEVRNSDNSIAIMDPAPQYEAESIVACAPNSISNAATEVGPGTSMIAIVDHRALGREVLTTALRTADGGFSSRTYAEIGDWLVDENRYSTSTILLGIGGTGSDDPDLSADLRSLTRSIRRSRWS